MNIRTGSRRRRGIALILALLTTVILVTLSMAFVSLSLREARTSRSYGYEETSLQAASYGLESALTYMGRGSAGGFFTWKPKNWPNPGNDPALDFGFYNVLNIQEIAPVPLYQQSPSGPNQELYVAVLGATTDPSLLNMIPALRTQNNASEDSQIKEDIRRIKLVDKQNIPVIVTLSPELGFTCDVVVVPVLGSRGQGRHDYRMISTARVYTLANGQANLNVPVATRVIEARVKESSFDYAHFVSNARSWNVNGYTPQETPITQYADLTDYVVIPDKYREEGPMRIDGQDDSKLDPQQDLILHKVYEKSGNLKFLANANGDNGPKFTHKVTINRTQNIYPDSVNDSTMGGFTGGYVPKASSIGIPDFRVDDMKRAAKYKAKDGDVSGLIEVATAQIPGALGSAQAAPKSSDPKNPFYDGVDIVTKPDGSTIEVPRPFDFRPRFPNVEVTLSKNKVQIQTRSTLDNSVSNQYEISQDNLASGLVVVQGGNVVVKTDANAKFQGKLSVVAVEDPARDSVTVTGSSIYNQAARSYFDYQKNRWDSYVNTHHTLPTDPENYPTPPYSAAQLRTAEVNGLLPPNVHVEPGLPNNQKLWPVPPSEKDKNGAPVRYSVEREGNIVIADNVEYDKNAGNQLGLFAQNFVLLNSKMPASKPSPDDPDLTIDAVLVSKERTVSFDWDNTGRQNEAEWKKVASPIAPNQPQRKVKINGSVIAEYIDVEGDQNGRGFKNQEFKYDLSLRNANPPFMPRPDLAALPGGFRFMILHYVDRGALSSAGILP